MTNATTDSNIPILDLLPSILGRQQPVDSLAWSLDCGSDERIGDHAIRTTFTNPMEWIDIIAQSNEWMGDPT